MASNVLLNDPHEVSECSQLVKWNNLYLKENK